MDKLLQILDPKYYVDRDVALRQLFALTSLIVANRGAMAQAAFDQLFDQAENRSYRSHMHFCSLPGAIAEFSATAVRENLAAGKEIASFVPTETATFFTETRALAPRIEIEGETVEAYAVRQRLFELLFAGRSQGTDKIDFFALVNAALSHAEAARALRSASSLEALLQLYHPVLQ